MTLFPNHSGIFSLDECVGKILERDRAGQPELVMQPVLARFEGGDDHVINRVEGQNAEENQDEPGWGWRPAGFSCADGSWVLSCAFFQRAAAKAKLQNDQDGGHRQQNDRQGGGDAR